MTEPTFATPLAEAEHAHRQALRALNAAQATLASAQGHNDKAAAFLEAWEKRHEHYKDPPPVFFRDPKADRSLNLCVDINGRAVTYVGAGGKRIQRNNPNAAFRHPFNDREMSELEAAVEAARAESDRSLDVEIEARENHEPGAETGFAAGRPGLKIRGHVYSKGDPIAVDVLAARKFQRLVDVGHIARTRAV